MSKTIDQKVVEMRFDNKQFEQGVSTTMSSVEKLKKSLNFTGATKGLENVGTTAKKIDMSGLARTVETVQARFSALEVVGVTALANITNSAVNAGKRIVSALTISPVMTGFQEYETQINAIQTILANTQSKGTTLDDVTAALDELNTYADQTIYNFTEMTRNIGTFTAAGVDLDKSVTAIKGIANLAAVSGSNAQQASTAMYQLSQALAAGRVSLMDWNSVVNAGMGGEVFQNALKRTAENMGHNVDALIKKYGSFRESLTKGQWLTADVLTETLTQLSGAYTEADLIAQGYTKQQAKDIVELANTAVSAATDVKTFTGLIDTLKESLQSGWTNTWEIIIGDFEEAKELFSEVSEVFGGIIQSSADARNSLLEGALTSNWDKLTKKINEAGVANEKFTESLTATVKSHGYDVDALIKQHGSLENAFKNGALSSDLLVETLKQIGGVTTKTAGTTEDMTSKLEYFQKVVNDVWQGDYKNGEERVKALTAAGYDYAKVQDLVNKTVDGHKLTLADLGDAQLKNIGYTNEEISKIRELAEEAEKSGTPINELIENLSRPSGRELLIDSFRNALTGLISVCKAVGDAWRDAFPPMTSDQLYNIIKNVHEFSETLVPTEETLDKLTRTLKGLFAILDIITTITGGALRIAFKAFASILGMADVDILTFTAYLGDAAVGLRNFLFDNELASKGFELMVSGIETVVTVLKQWIDAFKNLPFIQDSISNIGTAIDSIKDRFTDLSQVGEWAIEGLQNGLSGGLESIPKLLLAIGTAILETIKGVLGINSPSKEMYEIGKFSIEGLVNGFRDGLSSIVSVLSDIASQSLEIVKEAPWGSIAAAGLTIGLLMVAKDFANAIGAFAAPLEGLGDLLSGAGAVLEEAAKPIAKVIKSVSNVINSYALSIKANALKSVAIAIGILAASVFLLAQLDAGRLWSSIGALAALAGIIGLLSVSVGKFGPDKALSFSGFALAVVGLSTSLLIMASALKKIESIDPDRAAQTIAGFVGIVGSMIAIIASYGLLVRGAASANIAKVGAMMLGLSASLLLMIGVIKLISGLSAGELLKGGVAITAFVGIVGLLATVTQVTNANVSKLGTAMIKLSVAMGLMVGVIKLISGISVGDLVKGGAAITAFVGILGLLTVITNFGSSRATKLGGTLMAMSASMLIMVGVIKLMSGMNVADILKGQAAILAFTGILALMTTAVRLAGPDAPKLAATLLAMSLSIGILASIAVVLSLIDIEGMTKGLVVVGVLSAFMAGLIAVTKYAQDCKANLIVLTVAIGILAASVAALSFIEPKALAGATASLSILMGMFALLIKASGTVNGSMSTLIVMSAAIAVLGGVVFALAGLPIEATTSVAISLSALLLALSAAMKILGTIKTISPTAIAALGALSLIGVGLAALLNIIKPLDAGSSIETAISLSVLLTAFSGITAILAGVGKLGAASALQGVLALSGVIVVIGALMASIGALATYFPAMEDFVNRGIGLLESIGYGIGSFVGHIVGGLLSGVTSGLPDIGTNLSDFMANLQPFIEGASAIDPSAVASVGSLAQMILTLTGANILDAIGSFITGKTSLERFGEQLVPFGEAMAAFSDTIKGRIDAESVTAASNAGLALAQMAATIPKQGGVLQNFLGEQNLESFGSQLKIFGEAMAVFSDTVKGRIDANAVTAASNAGLTLSELATKIPKQGGVLQDFLGTQDLGVFGSQLKLFGEAIAAFSQTVTGKINPEIVTSAANAGMALGELATKIPKQGGVLQNFFGTQDLGVFGNQLKTFGEAIVEFSKSVNGKVDAETAVAASSAGAALADLATKLPKQGGIFQNFFGTQDMGAFGEQLSIFGQKFGEYAEYVKNVDAKVVTSTANAADSLVKLAESLPDNKLFTNETTLDEFGSQLAEFGSYYAQYYNSISGINTQKLEATIDGIWSLIELGNGMDGLNTKAMSSFADSLIDLANSGIDGFINAFSNATSRVQSAANSMLTTFITSANSRKMEFSTLFEGMVNGVLTFMENRQTQFRTSGLMFMSKLLEGVNVKKPEFNSSMNKMLNDVISAIRGKYDSFRSAGVYLVSGFANGMTSNGAALRAARNLAQNTIKAMQSELKIASPSKVARDEVGHWIVEGVSEGITEDMSAEEAASQKAQNITNAFQNELSLLDLAEETADLESQLQGTAVSNLVKHERQVKRVELAYGEYQVMLENVGETAVETQEAYNKYLQEEIELRELAEEQAAETYQSQIDWIEKVKETSNLSLVEEMTVYKRLQSMYVAGSEERMAIDEKLLSLQEELADATEEYYDSLNDIQEEANDKRLQIDQDYEDQRTQIKEDANNQRLQLDQEYADKTKEIQDQLTADIEAAEKAYEDAVTSRTESLYNSYGLFDKVEPKEEAVSGDTLIENLESQLTAFEDWTQNLNSLVDKGLDEALIEELKEMGPSSAAEIEALNNMSSEQLDKYVELWRSKHALAKDQAILELEGMREETDATIDQLRVDAEIKLDEYRETWRDQIRQLNDDTDEKLDELRDNWRDQLDDLDRDTQDKLDDLRDNWMKSVMRLETETESAFTKMTLAVVNTLGNRNQWSATGANMIQGVLNGVIMNTPALVRGVEEAMEEALDAANRTLGINSPSKEFMKVGRYSDEGFVAGLKRYAGMVSTSAAEVGKSALESLRNSISGISDVINGDFDTQPTIRPVLDLSNIEAGANKLNTMFSRKQALSISTGIQKATVEDPQNEPDTRRSGNVYQFTQNNYSPKSLSRVDIYRQTKNLFSAQERMAET